MTGNGDNVGLLGSWARSSGEREKGESLPMSGKESDRGLRAAGREEVPKLGLR